MKTNYQGELRALLVSVAPDVTWGQIGIEDDPVSDWVIVNWPTSMLLRGEERDAFQGASDSAETLAHLHHLVAR